MLCIAIQSQPKIHLLMLPKPWFFISHFSKSAKFLYLFICFGFTAFSTLFAQISISFPTNRIVFQRNNDNFGYINILGNYTQSLDKIEARLTPVLVGQGIDTDWILVQEKPKAGYFAGRIGGNGGWYKLEIRAMKGNVVLKIITVDKVGIGEVFIALGQSNAQGIPNYGAKGASDDRVNTINFQNTDVLDPLPENLNFVQLGQNVNVAPQGDGPWCYGELGDRLVKRFNVPVAFFNEGLLLVSVINWRESAEGIVASRFHRRMAGIHLAAFEKGNRRPPTHQCAPRCTEKGRTKQLAVGLLLLL